MRYSCIVSIYVCETVVLLAVLSDTVVLLADLCVIHSCIVSSSMCDTVVLLAGLCVIQLYC